MMYLVIRDPFFSKLMLFNLFSFYCKKNYISKVMFLLFLMIVWSFHTMPIRLDAEGGLASLFGMVWYVLYVYVGLG